jgi:hypothetical protein
MLSETQRTGRVLVTVDVPAGNAVKKDFEKDKTGED